MQLHATVDFYDEMMTGVWTPELLLEYFQMIRASGVTRVSWIDQKDIMTCGGIEQWNEFAIASIANFPKPFNRAVVETAHRAGLEIFCIIKPFDLAVPSVTGGADEEFDGRVPAVGRRIKYIVDFAAGHQDVMMRRRPSAPSGAPAVLVLRSREAMPPGSVFQLYHSSDNFTYCPVGAAVAAAEGACEARFPLAGIETGFLAVALVAGDCVNALGELAAVEDAAGRRCPMTLGSIPRFYQTLADNHLAVQVSEGGGFTREGFLFDHQPGVPSSIFPGERAMAREFRFSEAAQRVLGVALECNRCVPGAPEPAEPRARQFWLEWIAEELGYGFDGVDVRISNHNSPLEWPLYGFNLPVVEEYRRRYGVDPAHEDFDMEKWRRLRGEYYTGFLADASRLVRGMGKRFSAHIPDMAFTPPSQSTMMEIHWDYRSWLERKLVDEVTFKVILTDGFDADGAALAARCRELGVPVNFSPFLHCVDASVLDRAAAAGCEAFVLYETATVWVLNDGRIAEVDPARYRPFFDWFKKH